MPNPYVNKVTANNVTLIDLTSDTVTPSTLMQGYTAHDKSGALITGTATGGGAEAGTVTQDAQGYLVLDDEESSGSVTVDALSVTANGTYTASEGHAYSPVTVAVPSGGGGDSGNRSDPIRFFDYDGTLVASYTSAPSSLPANPSHEGLVAQGWNRSLEDIAMQFASSGACDVGQMYTTSDGRTRIHVTVSDATKSFWFGLAPNGTLSIDWGDGSESSSMTGTSYTTIVTVQHTYATAGSYVISVEAESGGFAFYSTSSGYTRLLNKDKFTGNYYNQAYGGCVTAIELGDGARVGNDAFSRLFNMRSITIPDGVTSIGTYAFCYCYALESITIPDGVTSIGTYSFQNCYSIKSITIPDTVTSISTYAFSNCYALKSVTIPDSVTSISGNMFTSCFSLESVTIPDGVTSIGSNAFVGCYNMDEYHFLPTTPPTLTNTSAFTNIQSDCKMYVPYSADHSILEAYQTATNWSTYASRMVEEEA